MPQLKVQHRVGPIFHHVPNEWLALLFIQIPPSTQSADTPMRASEVVHEIWWWAVAIGNGTPLRGCSRYYEKLFWSNCKLINVKNKPWRISPGTLLLNCQQDTKSKHWMRQSKLSPRGSCYWLADWGYVNVQVRDETVCFLEMQTIETFQEKKTYFLEENKWQPTN